MQHTSIENNYISSWQRGSVAIGIVGAQMYKYVYLLVGRHGAHQNL